MSRAATAPADYAALDAHHRERALDLGASFIVQAPAGAGKTELLTQRFLGLLGTVEAPEQIVAITFTRKAAAEMKNRILLRLAKAEAPEPEAPHEKTSWHLARAARARDAAAGWGLMENPDRLRVTTIDALCASLVRQMPYLSRFGGMPRIAERPDLHYEEAARRAIAAVEDFPPVAEALACLDNDAGRLRRLLVGMLAFREQWLPHIHGLRGHDDEDARTALGAQLAENLRHWVTRDLAAAAAHWHTAATPALMAAARHVAVAAGSARPDFAALADWIEPLGTTEADVPCWRALAALLLNKEGQPRRVFDARIGLPAKVAAVQEHRDVLKEVAERLAAQPAAQEALRAAARCPTPVYDTADLAAIEIFAEVLVLAAGFLWTVFQEAGETDFSAIAERALAALGDARTPTDLALRLDHAIRHLLVDEFQDTNPQQIELLERLTAGWQPGDGRSLFLVGDPMQSIYRFRKADVGLFLRAWQGGLGDIALEPLTLYRNNRSIPAIVDWINAAFAGIFPPVSDPERGGVAYSAAIATRADEAGSVWVHPLLVPKEVVEGDALGAQIEAQTMLDLIDATWSARPEADIAVLVRARDHLAPLIDLLRRARPTLRYEAVEIESLRARQPVQDLLALTHALHHGADRVHWLAVLRAPWCGLQLADLHALARVAADERSPPTLWAALNDSARCASLSAAGQARLAHVREALQPLLLAPGRLPARRRVESAWLRLGGAQCLAGASDEADVAAFFELLDRLPARDAAWLDRLGDEVARLYAAPSSAPEAGRLRFMTIHKSKGLEFDTVLLPGLHRRGGRDGTRLLTWDSRRDARGIPRLVVAPCRFDAFEDGETEESGDDGKAEGDHPIRRYIEGIEAARADQEMRRLLYVAATRARRSLHLLAVHRPKRDTKTGAFVLAPSRAAGVPIHILWPVLADEFEAAAARLDAEDSPLPGGTADGALAAFTPRLQRLPWESLRACRERTAAVVQGRGGLGGHLAPVGGNEVPARISPSRREGDAEAPSAAAHVGTLTHRYLEQIAREGLAGWDAARIEACRAHGEKWLRQQGESEAASRRGAQQVLAALTRTLASERGRWILRSRPAAASELALTGFGAEGVRNHVIDRSFTEDGVRWIIDYKTGAAAAAEQAEPLIAARRAEYAPQLARYAALFADQGLPVRQALYFVDLDRFEELT